jgi:hypothetical protein
MFKVGDLVRLKRRIGRNKPQEIWLVLSQRSNRTGSFSEYIRVQSVHTGEICQYNIILLQHLKSEEVCK